MIKSRKVSMYIVVIVISIFGLAFSCQQTTRTEVEDFTPYVQTTTTELQKIIKLADRVIPHSQESSVYYYSIKEQWFRFDAGQAQPLNIENGSSKLLVQSGDALICTDGPFSSVSEVFQKKEPALEIPLQGDVPARTLAWDGKSLFFGGTGLNELVFRKYDKNGQLLNSLSIPLKQYLHLKYLYSFLDNGRWTVWIPGLNRIIVMNSNLEQIDSVEPELPQYISEFDWGIMEHFLSLEEGDEKNLNTYCNEMKGQWIYMRTRGMLFEDDHYILFYNMARLTGKLHDGIFDSRYDSALVKVSAHTGELDSLAVVNNTSLGYSICSHGQLGKYIDPETEKAAYRFYEVTL